MPNPVGSDLHVNVPLSDVSVAWALNTGDFIADQVFPSVPVDKRSDIFWKYSKSDYRRTNAQKRAPGTESAGLNWNVNTDNYYADVFAVHDDITDQDRANADSYWQLDTEATERVTNDLLLMRDLQWASQYFQTGVWGTEYTGVGTGPTGSQFLQWNLAASDPLANMTKWRSAFKLNTTKDANTLVLGRDVWDALQNHPAILDRIKYTQKGVVTKDLVKAFFDVDKLLVAQASVATGPEIPDAAAQDAAASYNWILGSKSALLCYAPSRPSRKEPSAGYTFKWKGYGAGNKQGLSISSFRMQHIKSDRVEGEAAYTMKVVSADCGLFLNTAVA